MAPKRASAIITSIKAAFSKSKSIQSTSAIPEADAGIAGTSQATIEVPPRASPSTLQAGSRVLTQADTVITIPFSNFIETVPQKTLAETVVAPLASWPPNTTTMTTSRPTSARPFDIISQHASLLLAPGPQTPLINLHAQLSQTSTFTSPLPVNPAAAPLSRAHFKCPAKHARLKKSSNAHAPTLCTTCHGSGDTVLAQCRCCYFRVCKRCASLLGSVGNDLEGLLEELVKLKVWRGLQGQG